MFWIISWIWGPNQKQVVFNDVPVSTHLIKTYLVCKFFVGEDVFEVELLETSDVELKLDFATNFSAHLRHMTAKSRFSFGFKVLFVSSRLAIRKNMNKNNSKIFGH